jgi:XTP/dITP diphosphohydrolase
MTATKHRLLAGQVVIATHNAGKLREMRELLAPYGIDLVSAGELGLAEPDETGHMFAENAAIKAHAAAKASALPALADDSGICVYALDGAPGLFSANWAEKTNVSNKDFAPARARVERELLMRGATSARKRRAHFVSALVIAWSCSRAAFLAPSSRRGADRMALAMMPSSSPMDTSAPLAR